MYVYTFVIICFSSSCSSTMKKYIKDSALRVFRFHIKPKKPSEEIVVVKVTFCSFFFKIWFMFYKFSLVINGIGFRMVCALCSYYDFIEFYLGGKHKGKAHKLQTKHSHYLLNVLNSKLNCVTMNIFACKSGRAFYISYVECTRSNHYERLCWEYTPFVD